MQLSMKIIISIIVAITIVYIYTTKNQYVENEQLSEHPVENSKGAKKKFRIANESTYSDSRIENVEQKVAPEVDPKLGRTVSSLRDEKEESLERPIAYIQTQEEEQPNLHQDNNHEVFSGEDEDLRNFDLTDKQDQESKLDLEVTRKKENNRKNVKSLLTQIDGKYDGQILLKDQDYIDSTGSKQYSCELEIICEGIDEDQAQSTINLFKSPGEELFFKLTFSGNSIYDAFTMDNNNSFNIDATELGYRFSLSVNKEKREISGDLLVLSDKNEWKVVGKIDLK